MIGKLKGRVDTRTEDHVIIDVGGVGYEVFCHARALINLPEAGEFVTLLIETHVREDHIHLYGFLAAEERQWFRLLTTVQGVGVKIALAVLGLFTPAQLIQMIAAKDVKRFTQVSGVGAKMAERIVSELKDKAAKLSNNATILVHPSKKIGLPPASLQEDAISALTHLGYSRSDAYEAVARTAGREENPDLNDIITRSLKALAR